MSDKTFLAGYYLKNGTTIDGSASDGTKLGWEVFETWKEFFIYHDADTFVPESASDPTPPTGDDSVGATYTEGWVSGSKTDENTWDLGEYLRPYSDVNGFTRLTDLDLYENTTVELKDGSVLSGSVYVLKDDAGSDILVFSKALSTAIALTGANFSGTPIRSMTLGNYTTSGTLDQSQVYNPSFASNTLVAVVCFGEGTLIMTEEGERAVETLAVGDMVKTFDGEMKPIKWIGSRRIMTTEKTAPIEFLPNAIGNKARLVLSPNHRVYFTSPSLTLVSDELEGLCAAKHFVDGKRIRQFGVGQEITYYHFLFEDHELVFAEGAIVESLNPGIDAMNAMAAESRNEVLALFPELRHLTHNNSLFEMVRPELLPHELIAARKFAL